MGWEGLARIDVEKSFSHQLSQNEIASDNPCYQHLSGNILVSGLGVNQELTVISRIADDSGVSG